MQASRRLRGVLSPVLTPFDTEPNPDAARLTRHCRWLLDNDVGLAAGSETFLLHTLRAGGAGCTTATGNVNPAAIARLATQWQAADADPQQQRLDAVRAMFQKYPMIAAMQAALAHSWDDPVLATVRPPSVELNAEQRQALIGTLQPAGLILSQPVAEPA